MTVMVCLDPCQCFKSRSMAFRVSSTPVQQSVSRSDSPQTDPAGHYYLIPANISSYVVLISHGVRWPVAMGGWVGHFV
jgi:hypothetical protein